MINKILILTTVLLVLLGKTNGQLLAQPPGYVLTFEDNFNGTQLDLTKWSFCPEWFRQGGCYWEADNHQLTGNGTLQLIVSESAGKVYCGAIRTKDKFKQTHGYFEVRCKLPQIHGGWAAFWMMPQNGIEGPLVGSGQDGMELDIFETINGWNNKVQHALHWDGYEATLHKVDNKVHDRPDLYDNNYHVMALEWTPTEYIFYIDGQVMWKTMAGGVSQVDSYLKLTLEVSGATWPGLWSNQKIKPIFWDIDYVRAYKKSTAVGTNHIESHFGSNVQVYPNPFTNSFRVDGVEGNLDLKIYNCSGQVVYKNKASNSVVPIDLMSGIYFLNIKQIESNKSFTTKLIKN